MVRYSKRDSRKNRYVLIPYLTVGALWFCTWRIRTNFIPNSALSFGFGWGRKWISIVSSSHPCNQLDPLYPLTDALYCINGLDIIMNVSKTNWNSDYTTTLQASFFMLIIKTQLKCHRRHVWVFAWLTAYNCSYSLIRFMALLKIL